MQLYHRDTIEEIKNYLLNQNETIAVAESVTAGHLQIALSTGDNATQYFQGGITTYNLAQKTRHLHVDPVGAAACNCVSLKVAAEMARGVCGLFASTWGIGITGYASPLPEWGVTDRFAFYAIAYHGDIVDSKKLESASSKTADTQLFYVNQVLENFLYVLANDKSSAMVGKFK